MSAFRILVIEDNPDHAFLVEDCLHREDPGVQIDFAGNSCVALGYLEERRHETGATPDLLLIDINMPGMNGLDLLRHIKRDEQFKCIPAVVLSTSVAQSDIQRAYEYRANSYAEKSVDFDDWQSSLVQLLRYWRDLNQGMNREAA